MWKTFVFEIDKPKNHHCMEDSSFFFQITLWTSLTFRKFMKLEIGVESADSAPLDPFPSHRFSLFVEWGNDGG